MMTVLMLINIEPGCDYFVYVYRFSGSRAILSGPAGGVVGYALTTYNHQTGQPVIGFDMGGNLLLDYVVSESNPSWS